MKWIGCTLVVLIALIWSSQGSIEEDDDDEAYVRDFPHFPALDLNDDEDGNSCTEGDHCDAVRTLPKQTTIGYETFSPMDEPGSPKVCDRVPVVKLKKGCTKTRKECRNPDPAGGPLGCKEVCSRSKTNFGKLPALIKLFERQEHCQPCDRHYEECYAKHCSWQRQNTCAKPLAPKIGWKPVRTCTKTIGKECAKRMKGICEKQGLSLAECAPIVCNEDPVDHCSWSPVAVYQDHHEPLTCGPEGAVLCKDEYAVDQCIARAPIQCGEMKMCMNTMTLLPAMLHFNTCKLECKVKPFCEQVPDISCYEVVLERQC